MEPDEYEYDFRNEAAKPLPMISKEEALFNYFDPDSQDCQTPREDLRLSITLNPSLDRIEAAMEEYAKSYAESKSQEVAIGFHQFVMDNVGMQGKDEKGYWHILNGDTSNPLTTDELFLKYLQSKEQ